MILNGSDAEVQTRAMLDENEHAVRLELLRVRGQLAALVEVEALLTRRLGAIVLSRALLDGHPVAVAIERASQAEVAHA